MHARLLLALAAVGIIALSGCGGGDDPPPTTTAPTRPATVALRGYQFEARLPATWTDVSAQVSQGTVVYDVAYGDRTATGFKPSVLVARERTAAIGRQSIEQTVAGIRKATKDATGSATKQGDPVRVGGTEALQDVTRGTQGGESLVKRQIYVKHDGTLFTVAFTSAAGDAKADAALRSFLASWRWTAGNEVDPDAPAGEG